MSDEHKMHLFSKPGKPSSADTLMAVMMWKMGDLFRVKAIYHGGATELRSYKHRRSAVRRRRQLEHRMREQDVRGIT